MQPYFDNAATSFPKPQCVIDAMVAYHEKCGASPGRGAYAQAVEATDILDKCRSLLCELVHAPSDSHCIFTLNCTDALNLAINGIASHFQHEETHIVTTAMDHNSVLRPLHALEKQGVAYTVVQACQKTGLVNPSDIAEAITPTTKLVAIAHGSNVTGTVQDIEAIGRVCSNTPLLVDAAQTMGHTAIDMQEMNIALLAFPGHKGLLGPLGTGGLIMQNGIEQIIAPHRFGGTGSASEHPVQPTDLPDKYESGSHNMVGISGLTASLQWIKKQSVQTLHQHEMELCDAFVTGLRNVANVKIIGPQTNANRCGVFSLAFEEKPNIAAQRLEQNSGIRSRAGLHCAPFAHQTMGTTDCGGTVRVSFGPFHSLEDVLYLIDSIERCATPELVTT
ncbi:MAG: aminotransferase class V-fold PLP-dependent enzyme [Planctomycetes bacterium]|nr:aminotransferase class V-fold PLP-dependent enzyme [Planctomycetota bacterium]